MNKYEIKMNFQIEWQDLCKRNLESTGDIGSCVLGASVIIEGMEIEAWDVTRAQGSLVWEDGLEELMQKYRDKYGVSIRYNPGNMD